jgi:hypothetical protein
MPLPQAGASTPAFTNNLPTANTAFPLLQSVLQTDTGTLTGIQFTDGATLTRTGSATVTGRTAGVYDLKIPGLNVTATGLLADGSLTTLPDGRKVAGTFVGLKYTILGSWALTAAGSGPSYLSMAVSGYQSSAQSVPALGSATYVGNSSSGSTAGTVLGAVFSSSGSTVQNAGTVQGNVSMTVNFLNQKVSGALSNMTATDIISGATTPWNTVNLDGSLVGVNLQGRTTTDTASGTLAFDKNSVGNFNGSLFGPNIEEAGVVWTLHDSTGGGKTAVGMFAATKQ